MTIVKRARAVFIDGAGTLYAPWRFILALAAGLGAWLGARYLAGRVFFWLFDAWNINANTLARAPEWAKVIARLSPRFINIFACAVAFACSRAAEKYVARARLKLCAPRRLGAGTLLGAACALITLGIILAADSARIMPNSFHFSFDICVALIERFAACIFIAQFLRANVARSLGDGKLKYAAYALSICAQPALVGAFAAGVSIARVLNAMLAAALFVYALRAYGGIALETGAAFAFAGISEVIFGFPNGGMLDMYAVSEDWLTGGAHGIAASPLVSIMLIGALALIYRHYQKQTNNQNL